ncbi:UDP-glucose/GDP-mannose dehydrogenase family protein [Exiguobacterium sp. SH3S2]|uniref:UDP-glucose dehydrogenase family protein n=1 Tax=unclassified Exiguobacterium TaxID=2644629 RepID=UPI001038CE49|nr:MULTISPECIES: UDP-glucose/GDP-mannose dehydrogenase family protein [unclassified Exiguobacterium]TCI27098.1 UDP-glucose/GDP-mannose dehydrogenase family protein [Exiguobacterium sp. SH5S4]TCI46185.1 UDP-glucose/GDP-mannose dehydrogenase family protein [Exiguobacterium sp. SH3S3]TCI61273.1 UDP-glucose/GDP-mannose dehydrogenase family protein [Exiguobacterium sp. SH3S2]TCI64045.1 UDP-glucose/GDP-mannose dehydrogenase family protein [Exiguobacterium sp. SH3S1]
MKFGIIGLGYVGLATLCGLAKAGHEVIGVEKDQPRLRRLMSGHAPFHEPGMAEVLQDYADSITLTDNTADTNDVDYLFLAVGTPSKEDGSCDMTFVDAALSEINTKQKIVIRSTVPPGTTDLLSIMYPFHTFAVMPEFLQEGRALADVLKPHRVVIGSGSLEISEELAGIYGRLGVPIVCTTPINAELIKYASNAFLATKISFMNDLSRLADKAGADIATIADGMGLDPRIGRSYLNAGLGYGGSCFPKDMNALLNVAAENELDLPVIRAAIQANDEQIAYVASKIEHRPNLRVAFLGLAFKPGTDDMRDAPSITLANHLRLREVEVVGYDPLAKWEYRQALTPEEALKGADVAILVTEWDELVNLKPEAFAGMRTKRLIDARNAWKYARDPEDVEYEGVGRMQGKTNTPSSK